MITIADMSIWYKFRGTKMQKKKKNKVTLIKFILDFSFIHILHYYSYMLNKNLCKTVNN